jgi:hypothetical protein
MQNAGPQPLRKFIDCRDYPNEVHCTLRISGSEDEVMQAARFHTVTVHGMTDTPELVRNLREMMRDELPE